MTASACRYMPSGWSAAGSFGPRPQPASFRSLRRNSLTCWMGSIGEIPSTHGGPLIEARAKLSGAEALIEHLRLVIAKMKREMFGPRSERTQRLIDQLELQLEELAAAAEDERKAEAAK